MDVGVHGLEGGVHPHGVSVIVPKRVLSRGGVLYFKSISSFFKIFICEHSHSTLSMSTTELCFSTVFNHSLILVGFAFSSAARLFQRILFGSDLFQCAMV